MKYKKIIFMLFITFWVVFSIPADAHQPRIVEGEVTQVVDPEVSKAYYATLSGAPHTYTIESEVDFNLYVSILLPDIPSADKSTIAEVFKGEERIAFLGGDDAKWKSFFEPFGQSKYLDGGEYKTRAEAGVYTIKVSSQKNDNKYSLAVGEIEVFDRAEGTNALSLIPKLKRDFFNESPIGFIYSPFGWGLLVAMYVLAAVVGLLYRAVLNFFAKGSARGAHNNIGKKDRFARLGIGLAFLVWAITTTWSPILLFISGFAVFEAVVSWCGLYAIFGKNTCSVV